MEQAVMDAVESAARQLEAKGHEIRYYVIPNSDSYASVTSAAADIYGLEMRLGPAANQEGVSAWGVAQLPDPEWRNLCFMTMIEREDATGRPLLTRSPVYNVTVDQALDFVFLPTLFTAWRDLDPRGKRQGVVVQAYQAAMTLSNLPNATRASLYIMGRYKKDGQLALVAVDFDDPLITLVANLVTALPGRSTIHFYPKTKTLSAVTIPLPHGDNEIVLIKDHSTALDQGFATARKYLIAER
ncbi:MAG: hypothetical protein KJ065_14720 [Anaerolineae bacterium]|nr:hypothetical protein [Anaerolineae bacterium]